MDDIDLLIAMWAIVLVVIGLAVGHSMADGKEYVEPQISAEDAIQSAEFQGYAQCGVDRIYEDKVVLNCLTDNDAVADSREVVVGYTTERDVGVIS